MRTEKLQFLADCGFEVGVRDPQLNRAFKGKFMALECREDVVGPTDDGRDGPWCIVGDDLNVLIDMAFDYAVDVYEEHWVRRSYL